MRILIVSQYYWPEEFRINSVAKTLRKNGLDVTVLTGKPNYPHGRIFRGYFTWGCQKEIHEDIPIYRIPLIPRGRGGWRLSINYLSFIISGLIFSPWQLRRKSFDVIFIYGVSPILQAIPAIFLGWWKKCPRVLWVQDLWPESLSATGYVKNKRIIKFVELAVRYIYRSVELLLVQSQAFSEPVRGMAGKVPIKYFPNSVDSNFAVPATSKPPDVLGLNAVFSVMFAGNIGSAQAVEVIVEAATRLKEYPDIQFVVLGDGSSRAWMLQQVKVCGLTNLHLPGRFPGEAMPGFMQKASALLVTLANREIFAATVPNKVQAYMAAGRPIIACLPGEGARLVAEAKAGVCVPAEDGKALADAVLRLSQMTQEERDKMGRNGRAYFQKHFDHQMLVSKLIEYFKEVRGGKL